MPEAAQRTERLASLPGPEEDNWWFQWVMPSAWDDGKQIYDEETLGADCRPYWAPVWGGVQDIYTPEYHGSTSVEVQGRHWGLLAVWILWLQLDFKQYFLYCYCYYYFIIFLLCLAFCICRISAYRLLRRRILRQSYHKWKKCGPARPWAWWHSRIEENWCWKGQRQQRFSPFWRIVWWCWVHCWATGRTEKTATWNLDLIDFKLSFQGAHHLIQQAQKRNQKHLHYVWLLIEDIKR